MNWRAIRAIMRKDLKVIIQSKNVMIPLILVPLILLVVLPGMGGVYLTSLDPESDEIADFEDEMGIFYENLPESVNEELDQWDNDVQRLVVVSFVYFFAPMFLIMPVMFANIFAADSFVGEKERKTLEALLYSPTSDDELYIAKLLTPWLVAVILSVVGFIIYGVVINATTYSVMEKLFFPNLMWVLLALWVSPAAAGFGLGAMVLVSSRVSTFQEAYQIGGMVVLPVVLLLFGQIGGVVYFSVPVVFALGVILWAIDAAIAFYGAKTFRRGALISRL